jgi:hypothetical protein
MKLYHQLEEKINYPDEGTESADSQDAYQPEDGPESEDDEMSVMRMKKDFSIRTAKSQPVETKQTWPN